MWWRENIFSKILSIECIYKVLLLSVCTKRDPILNTCRGTCCSHYTATTRIWSPMFGPWNDTSFCSILKRTQSSDIISYVYAWTKHAQRLDEYKPEDFIVIISAVRFGGSVCVARKRANEKMQQKVYGDEQIHIFSKMRSIECIYKVLLLILWAACWQV